MDKVLTKIMADVAVKHNLSRDQVELIYTSMFKFIKEKLTAVDFDTIITDEDLRKAKVNFNIPRVFKLYTTKGRIDYAREAIRKSIAKHGEGVNVNNYIESAEISELQLDSAGPVRTEHVPESN